MTEWVLVLLVWTAGDVSPGGKAMGGHVSKEACLTQSQKDTPRMLKLYPPPQFEQVQWECVQRAKLKGPVKAEPNV